MGVAFSFVLDGYSTIFLLMISGIGSLIFLFSDEYMNSHKHRVKFYVWMLAFSGAMIGLVTSANLIILFLFWEMTTITSFFLIGLQDEEQDSTWNAIQAFTLTLIGGLAMLAGFLLIYDVLGTMEIPEITMRASELLASNSLIPIVVLIMLGVFTKSALIPFHTWLPRAMVAPTPVSAFLHSATMVTGGVFITGRFLSVFSGVQTWEMMGLVGGLATLLMGGILALKQTDLKALLAYSTISQLGIMVALYSIGTESAALAATIHLISHAIFKGGLFLVVGIVEHMSGTRDLNRLGGLAKASPLLAIIATLLVLSSGAVPPLVGFVSKELMLEAAINPTGLEGWLLLIVLVAGSIVTLAYSLKFLIPTFFSQPSKPIDSIKRIPRILFLAPGVLAGLSLLFGVIPQLLGPNLLEPAMLAITGEQRVVHIVFWNGFNLPFGFTIIATIFGFVSFKLLNRINKTLVLITSRSVFDEGYQHFVRFTYNAPPRIFWYLQNGDIRCYITAIVVFLGILVLAAFSVAEGISLRFLLELGSLNPVGTILAVFLGLLSLMLVTRKGRLEAVFSLGMIGMAIAVIFALYSAPDLALTQILVELLMIVLFVLVFIKTLRMFNRNSTGQLNVLHMIISIFFGGIVSVTLMAVLSTPQTSSIATFFVDNSLIQANAKNIVNTILIDFRGFDTMGEITVIGIAALSCFAMLRSSKEGD
jgi:multicomponent Na+:H+ antiporter subunit A